MSHQASFWDYHIPSVTYSYYNSTSTFIANAIKPSLPTIINVASAGMLVTGVGLTILTVKNGIQLSSIAVKDGATFSLLTLQNWIGTAAPILPILPNFLLAIALEVSNDFYTNYEQAKANYIDPTVKYIQNTVIPAYNKFQNTTIPACTKYIQDEVIQAFNSYVQNTIIPTAIVEGEIIGSLINEPQNLPIVLDYIVSQHPTLVHIANTHVMVAGTYLALSAAKAGITFILPYLVPAALLTATAKVGYDFYTDYEQAKITYIYNSAELLTNKVLPYSLVTIGVTAALIIKSQLKMPTILQYAPIVYVEGIKIIAQYAWNHKAQTAIMATAAMTAKVSYDYYNDPETTKKALTELGYKTALIPYGAFILPPYLYKQISPLVADFYKIVENSLSWNFTAPELVPILPTTTEKLVQKYLMAIRGKNFPNATSLLKQLNEQKLNEIGEWDYFANQPQMTLAKYALMTAKNGTEKFKTLAEKQTLLTETITHLHNNGANFQAKDDNGQDLLDYMLNDSMFGEVMLGQIVWIRNNVSRSSLTFEPHYISDVKYSKALSETKKEIFVNLVCQIFKFDPSTCHKTVENSKPINAALSVEDTESNEVGYDQHATSKPAGCVGEEYEVAA